MPLYVDEAIWGTPAMFAGLGTVRTFNGRALRPGDLTEADALIVRSVTRVNEQLLSGSPVRFVGTASSGTDHVDLSYLATQGITFADAAGCNSRTVAEYVLAALLLLAERGVFQLAGKVLGVIGVGRIGSMVAEWGQSLGMQVLLCDPPLERTGIGGPYVSASRLVADSDVISLHVPLVRDGPHATLGMVNDAWLSRIKQGAVFINTSRGDVVRDDDLLAAMESGRLGPIVLDVWNGEPNINPRLVQAAALATPHMAGYSMEARKRAALMIQSRLAEFQLATIGEGDWSASLPNERHTFEPAPVSSVSHENPWTAISRIVVEATGLIDADRALRNWIAGKGKAAGFFDELRAACSTRREFPAYRLPLEQYDDFSKKLLLDWGFHLG